MGVCDQEKTMKAKDIALRAAELVSVDRNISHGDCLDNHERIAAVWNGILDAAGKSPIHPLDAHDVANLMEGLKIARRYSGNFSFDDYVDSCGYSALAGEIRNRMLYG